MGRHFVDLTMDHRTVGYTDPEQPLEEDIEFRGTTHDDAGEVPALAFHLDHDIDQAGDLPCMEDGHVHDVVADEDDAVDLVISAGPSIVGVFVEHPAGDQLDRIIVDFFLILEILIDGGSGNPAFLSNERKVGISIPFTGKYLQRGLENLLFTFVMIDLFWHPLHHSSCKNREQPSPRNAMAGP